MKKTIIAFCTLLLSSVGFAQQNNIYQAFNQCATPQAIPGNPPPSIPSCNLNPDPNTDFESNYYVPGANSPTIFFRVNFVFLVHPTQQSTFSGSTYSQLQAGAVASVNYMNGKFAACGNIPSVLTPPNPSPLVANPKIQLVLNNVYRTVDNLAISTSFNTGIFYQNFPYDAANTVNIYLYDDPATNGAGWASFGNYCALAHTPGSVYQGGPIGGDLLWHELCHVFGFLGDHYIGNSPNNIDPVSAWYIPDDAAVDVVGSYNCTQPLSPPTNNNVMGNSACREVLSARQIAAFHYLVAKGVTTKFTQFSGSGYPYIPPQLTLFNTPQAYTFSGNQIITSLPSAFSSIIIPAGSNITINSAKLRAASNAKIIIQPTAKLTLNCVEIKANKLNENWEGIEVWGNVNTSQSVNGSGMPDYQGMLVINSSLIMDAKTAICVAKKIQNGIDYTFAGGIVNSNNSKYYNNQIGADFYPYFTFHRNPDWFGNRSYFKNDEFQFDGNTHDVVNVPPYAHIRGESVYNIRVYGCAFKMIDPTLSQSLFNPNPQITYAIFGTDSRFLIKDYCPNPSGPNTCGSTPVRNTFRDFVTAIRLSNTTSFNASVIDHASFDNGQIMNFGFIYVNNTKGVQVINNDFTIAAANYVTSPCYGLYLNNCDAYVVENNFFNGIANTKNTGLYINNSGPNANSIYNNKFDKLKQGLWAQNQNYDPFSGNGLVINCNDFLSNTYHIGVQKGGKCLNCPNNTGINVTQGQAFTSSDQDKVRNFYQTINCNSENKYYINTQSSFAVVNHGSFFGTTYHLNPYPSCSNPLEITDVGLTTANQAPPTKSIYCPVNFNASFGNKQIGEQLTFNRSQLKDLQAAYTAGLDGGDTQSLLNAISDNMSAGNLKNLLLSQAYLSDAVLNAYVLSSPPAGHLKQVHEKNAPVSNVVWQTILSQNLPNGIFNQMQSAQSQPTLSPRTAAESKIQMAQRQVGLLDSEKLRRFAQDSTGVLYDSIIAVYKLNELPNSQYDIVSPNIEAGYYLQAQELINDLSKTAANIDFCKLQQYALNIKKDVNALGKLKTDTGVKEYLVAQASSGYYLTAGIAEALLLKIYGIKTEEDRLEPSGNTGSRLIHNGDNEVSTVQLNEAISIYPNPAADVLNVSFETQLTGLYEIKIMDVTGKSILTQACNNTCSISLATLKSGIYFVNLFSNNVNLSTKKLVVIK